MDCTSVSSNSCCIMQLPLNEVVVFELLQDRLLQHVFLYFSA